MANLDGLIIFLCMAFLLESSKNLLVIDKFNTEKISIISWPTCSGQVSIKMNESGISYDTISVQARIRSRSIKSSSSKSSDGYIDYQF